MKVYTKTGDKGKTSLIGGTRVRKNDVRLEAYGTVDELNSCIGVLTTLTGSSADIDFLRWLQHMLFSIGSHLATDRARVELKNISIISEEYIHKIETEIDKIECALPPLQYFVLPGGGQASAYAHVCRTVARRAERRLIDMGEEYPVDDEVFVFFNRISDYLFVLSRQLSVQMGCKEIYWKPLEK